MDEIIAEFISETRDMLQHVSGELIAWERDPADRTRLDEIFRFVHTVKGSSGFLDLPRHQRLSHAAEDVLSELRAGSREPDAALVSAILAIIDRIGELTEALDKDEEIDADDEPLIAELTQEKTPGRQRSTASLDEAAGAPSEPSVPRGPVRSIRVPVELLDQLMAGVSDLVLSRNEFARRFAAGDSHGLDLAFERLSSSITDLRDRISWTRMQRIESLFAALPRLVRDISAQLGKSVALDIDGSDVELDREMIEMLRDPLTHIVRNAIDHGIESEDVRLAAEKLPEGRLSVAARQTGNRIEIVISDDGAGIDRAKLLERAVAARVVAESDIANLSDAERDDLIFHPGLTTAEKVSEISGRGVGMDVVRTNVERLGGTITVESLAGIGTTFRLNVPLTLTIIPSLVVGCGEETYAIPRPMIGEIVSLASDHAQVQRVGGGELLMMRGANMPLVRLSRLFGEELPSCDERFAVIVSPRKGERYALALDRTVGHEDLVVKPLAPVVMATGMFAGSALPDTGLPLLLLDIAGIADKAGLRLNLKAGEATSEDPARVVSRSDIQALVFDDCDKVRRAVRIGIVDRVIKVEAQHVRNRAGQLHLTLGGEILPVIAAGPLPESGTITMLRLTDGETDIAYAIGGPADIATLDGAFRPAREPGRIAGIVNQDDVPIELLDSHDLFAEFAGRSAEAASKLCRIVGGGDHWRQEILRPLVEMAGYRVVFDDEETDEPVDLVIEANADTVGFDEAAAAVLRLSDDRSRGDAVFRYDREAISDALDRHARAGGQS